TMTYFTPVCTSVSRSSRANALVPAKSCSTRLPLAPALSTARRCDCSRSARRFGQRWFVSGVEPKPSVTESPNVWLANCYFAHNSSRFPPCYHSSMRYLVVLFIHLIAVLTQLLQPGGARS